MLHQDMILLDDAGFSPAPNVLWSQCAELYTFWSYLSVLSVAPVHSASDQLWYNIGEVLIQAYRRLQDWSFCEPILSVQGQRNKTVISSNRT